MTPTDILESLLVSNHRLTRFAAQETGNKTPAGVWRTLSILASDGAMRIGELAASSRISQPAMTKLLPALVQDELVYRIADVDDSRAWLIAISSKGQSELDAWKRELAQAMEPLFGDLTAREWSTLSSAAQLLASRLGSAVAA
ncbi:MAG: MarR family transcriptional regulator [Glaciihabitans sp.]|nr:MarR family transcriptional regulator [Glaciihabitans sp.]